MASVVTVAFLRLETGARIRDYLLERNPLAAVAVAESLIAAGNNLGRLPRRFDAIWKLRDQ